MKTKPINVTLGLLLGVSMSAYAQKFSAEKLTDRAIYRRAVEAVIWGMPAVKPFNPDAKRKSIFDKAAEEAHQLIP
jgi:hypothetical protein